MFCHTACLCWLWSGCRHTVCTGLVQTVINVKVYPGDWCVMFDDMSAGTSHRDTVCELCADGHYANVPQTHAACVTHSVCKTDEQLVLPGSRWHDNVCAACDHITQKGTVTHTFTIATVTAHTITQITFLSLYFTMRTVRC